MAHTTSRIAAALALTIALRGCATTASLRSGQHAEQGQDYDRAVAEYTAALKKHPNDRRRQLVAAARQAARRRRITSRAPGGSKRPANSTKRWSSSRSPPR